MPESTKIEFRYRRISQLSDFTELVQILFPGNRKQQRAAACIFFELKWSQHIVPNTAYLQSKYGISRRVLERTRAKLSRFGLIEHISYLNSRYGGQHGWKTSGRFSSALRMLAEKLDIWRNDKQASKQEKERMLLDLL